MIMLTIYKAKKNALLKVLMNILRNILYYRICLGKFTTKKIRLWMMKVCFLGELCYKFNKLMNEKHFNFKIN